MTLLTTYFPDPKGERDYLPMLRAWLAAVRTNMPGARITVATTGEAIYALGDDILWLECALDGWAPYMRPEYPFDRKGALMCRGIMHSGPTLYLDLDAILVADPSPILRINAGDTIAMPCDQGARRAARGQRVAHLAAPYVDVIKCSAGVVWFGEASLAERANLIDSYRRAWAELRDLAGEDPRLLEQNAWSLVRHRHSNAILPDACNWPADHLGPNAAAVIHHAAGGRKWRTHA
jgi:hypothetical protein